MPKINNLFCLHFNNSPPPPPLHTTHWDDSNTRKCQLSTKLPPDHPSRWSGPPDRFMYTYFIMTSQVWATLTWRIYDLLWLHQWFMISKYCGLSSQIADKPAFDLSSNSLSALGSWIPVEWFAPSLRSGNGLVRQNCSWADWFYLPKNHNNGLQYLYLILYFNILLNFKGLGCFLLFTTTLMFIYNTNIKLR